MKLNKLISKLQSMSNEFGDVDVIVRGRLGFLSDIQGVTDDRSHDDDSPFVSIDVDEDDDQDYDDEAQLEGGLPFCHGCSDVGGAAAAEF